MQNPERRRRLLRNVELPRARQQSLLFREIICKEKMELPF
jgi:hypothetical protein